MSNKVLAGLLIILLAGLPAYAQLDRGTITGLVLDASGAAIPNASVVITMTSTNTIYPTQTNDVGQYHLPNLPIGTYSIKFEAPGFKVQQRENITLQISQVLRLDAQLEVGSEKEVVNVVADAPLLQTETPEVGTTVARDYLFDLPLSFGDFSGRSPEYFAYRLTPGVEGDTWTSRINGSPTFSKEVLLDGASVTSSFSGHFGETSVSIEALEEFKIQTSGLSAEYGRTGGGVFNFVMRSGQNAPHGSLFGQLRNEALNANSFANNASGRPRALERKHNFGGSFGAPIYIPKIYNGKDKSFFFFALERFRQRALAYGAPNRSVPQLEMYDGNLSRLLTTTQNGVDALGRPIFRGAIYDPLTLRQVNGQFVADPFPGNIIPSERISQVSRRISSIAKQHYAPISSALVANNLVPITSDPALDQKQWSFKIDHNLSQRQRISGSLARNIRPRFLTSGSATGGVWDQREEGGGPLSEAWRQTINSWLARIAHDFTLSPTVLNHFIISFNRMVNPTLSVHGGCGALLGIKGVLQDGPCPRINWGSGPAGVSFNDIGFPRNNFQAFNSWGIGDTVSWSKGKHNLKFGVDFRGNQVNNRLRDNTAGTFNFTSEQTGIPGVNFIGHSFASFLLGGVNNASVAVPLVFGGRTYYYSGFVQDDFKISPKLTLNIGLRYEFQPPQVEVADRTSNFDLNLTDPLTGMKGAVVFAGEGPGRTGSRTFVASEKKNFGPRFGFAYSPDGKTSIRSAYGIFYSPGMINGFEAAPFHRGFIGTNNLNNSLNYTSLFHWDNGYPGNFIAPVLDPASWRDGGVTHWDPGAAKVPYTQQWNLNIQREITSTMTIDVGYVGNKSSGIWVANDIAQKNQLDPKHLSLGSSLVSILNTDADAQRFGLSRLPYPAFAGGQLWQALVPFPHLARNGIGLATYNAPIGHSTYHSMQVIVNKRSSSGLNIYANYNLSKTIQNMEAALRGNRNPGRPLDYYNLSLEKGIADNDQTHTIKMAILYDLPIGRGRKLFSNMNSVLNALVGGWNVNFIGNYASGTPLRFTGSGIPGWNGRAGRPDLSNPDGASLLAGFDRDRLNFAAITRGNYSDHRYVRAGVFSDHRAFTLGNAGFTSNIRDPWTVAEDLGIRKVLKVREGHEITITGELLNVFNRHIVSGIITNVLDPRFGQVSSVSGSRVGQIGLRYAF
ncbi:MAG: TonB-dependent receptor [Acidobacteria bacterium]|nr:TonB-dependent receptor [Acidobacteriota bacterium]